MGNSGRRGKRGYQRALEILVGREIRLQNSSFPLDGKWEILVEGAGEGPTGYSLYSDDRMIIVFF